LRSLGLSTLEQLKRKLDAEADGLRDALATTAFFALKGDEHGQTNHFGEEGQKGFIHRYSAIDLLEKSARSDDDLRKLLEDLYKRALPWVGDGSRAKLTSYRPKADAFIGFVNDEHEHFGRKVTNLVKEMKVGDFECQHVRIDDPSEIILYTELSAFPAYYGSEVEGMRRSYEELLYNPKQPAPLHIHQDYHEFADPVPADDGAMVTRTLAWKVFLQAQMLGIIRSVKLRPWDEQRIAYEHRVREDARVAFTPLGPEGAVIRRLERDQNRFMQVVQRDIDAYLRTALEKGFTYAHLALLADYYVYCVFPVHAPTVMGGAGATEVVGSIANEKARELANDWRKRLAALGGGAPAEASAFGTWAVPISRIAGGVVPSTEDLPAGTRMEEWDHMGDVIRVIQRMVDDAKLKETRNSAGQVEVHFPRLAVNMDSPPAIKSAIHPSPAATPGVPRPPPPTGPELKLVYQMDEVRQGTGPMYVSDIAQSVFGSPNARHRVYHEKRWKDAASVPEVLAHLPSEDTIPDDTPPDDE